MSECASVLFLYQKLMKATILKLCHLLDQTAGAGIEVPREIQGPITGM